MRYLVIELATGETWWMDESDFPSHCSLHPSAIILAMKDEQKLIILEQKNSGNAGIYRVNIGN